MCIRDRFYPDPWPKRKHHKRRLLQKDFINLVNQKLRPEGIFYFKTDWSPYFTEAKKLLLNNHSIIGAPPSEDRFSIKLANRSETSFPVAGCS